VTLDFFNIARIGVLYNLKTEKRVIFFKIIKNISVDGDVFAREHRAFWENKAFRKRWNVKKLRKNV
jgi:hypothetical protein